VIKDPVIAVVVAYHPRSGELESSVRSLLQNFKEIVVVWNGPHPFKIPSCLNVRGIHVLDMRSNVGLAKGLNEGIEKAFKLGAAWVYLSDQDSVLPLESKKRAVKYSHNIPKPFKVAAIGLNYFNQITQEEGRIIRSEFLRRRRDRPNKNKPYIETDYVISSGSFISKTALNEIGLMDSKLFIDVIDVEWGLRAKNKGYKFFVLPKVRLDHKLGDHPFTIFGKAFPIHSPLRIYYYFRNSIHLYRKDYISLNWKLVDGTRNIFRFLFYVVLVKPRLKYMRMALVGTYHGITGRMGKF
jgi:rhamnosyltransferase